MIAQLLQAVVNGVIEGALISITAIGFTTIYAILRFPNLAIAGIATVGAFAGWWVNARWGLGLPVMLTTAALVAAVVGVVCDRLALRRLASSGALAMTIASIAVSMVLESAVRLVFGNDMRGFDMPIEPDLAVGPLLIDVQQLWNLAAAVLLVAAVFGFLT